MEYKQSDQLSQSPANLKRKLQQFRELLDRQIGQTWEAEKELDHLQQLVAGMKVITTAVLAIGDKAVQQSPFGFTSWFVLYEWMDQAKSFLILWRDVLFQEQKAWLQVSTGEVTTIQFHKLKEQGKRTVSDAASSLLSDLDSIAATHPLNNIKQIERWRLQDNPWPVYKEQLIRLPEQGDELLRQSKDLWNASGVFVAIGSHFLETYDAWLQQITKLKKGLTDLWEQLGKQDTIDATFTTEQLEQLHEQWLQLPGVEEFHTHLDDYLLKLPQKEKTIVGANGGDLLHKMVDLQKDTSSWLDAELVSEIYDLLTIKDSISNKINLSIVHIQNRLAAEKQNEEPPGLPGSTSGKQAVEQILSNFLKSLNKSEVRTRELKVLARRKLQNHFVITKIYDEEFLPRSLQYTISQYRESARWLEIRNWIKDKGARISQLKRNVEAEEALSLSERIVRVVNSRLPQKENSHYTNMFLTHGWIGDSFVVGRTAELSRVATIIDNWKLGFRGAVLLTGKRFCGKSLFGEVIDQRFFRNKGIKLIPHSRLILAGRHLKVGYDLKPALQFIRKNCVLEQTMVWIDDLESWQNDKATLAQNANVLLKFIDENAGRLFFVVSMSNWAKAHLAQAFDIDKVFQSEINLGAMSTTDIQEAILVRHTATHSELINETGQEATIPQLTKIINRISQLSEGNVGEALQRWAYTIEKHDDENTLLKDTPIHALPSFLSIDSAILLQAVMMGKKVNRMLLRKLFGPAFINKYQLIIQRMINLDILHEEQELLEVNPYLVNDIGKQLSQKLDFQYQFDSNSKKQVKL